MGLAGARNSAVTGLQSQSTNIAITSDNIANASTTGYKAVTGVFSTLVTSTGDSSAYSSGGVSITPQTLVEQQGLIESTGNATDLAISGAGFFAVEDAAGTLLLTRAGSFSVDNKGQLTNSAGFKLLGWPLDNDGRLPGQIGNANTKASESTDSLEVINTNAASGNASATTTIKVGMNLKSTDTTYQGATVTVAPSSAANSTITGSDIIIPGTGMQEGDAFSFTSNSATSTFTYGGFAKSKDISLSALYTAQSPTTTFTTTGGDLNEGDKFSITTASSGTTTFTFKQSSPSTSNGEFNTLASLATAINSTTGLTAKVSGTTLYVSATDATEAVTFADVTPNSNFVEELGFSNVAAAVSGVNRFNTLNGLSALVDAQTQLGSKLKDVTGGASTLDIFSIDPLQTLTLTKIRNSATIDLQSDENGVNTPTNLIVPVEVDGSSTMVPDTNGDNTGVGAAAAAVLQVTDGNGHTGNFTYGGIASTKNISAGILGATTESGQFTAGPAGGLNNNEVLTFGDGTGTVAVTFDTAAGTPAAGHFNSLDTLATAISRSGVFNARVANGVLYVASVAHPDTAVTATSTTSMTGVQMAAAFGGSWANNAGQVATLVSAKGGSGYSRFNTLSQLNTLVAGITNFTTTAPSGSNATLQFASAAGTQITIGGTNNAQLLSELGISSGAVGDGFFSQMGVSTIFAADSSSTTTALVPVTYDTGDPKKNMAGQHVRPNFSTNITTYDSLGTAHTFTMSFLKTGTNQWAVEFYAPPSSASEISNDTNGDGLLASGTITFNGKGGSLATVSAGLSNPITADWTTGSSPTTFSLNLGTAGLPADTPGATVIGLTDGLRQLATDYNVDFLQQNGVSAGQFGGITISEDGIVSAKFSNGQIKAIYKLPIMTVPNPNALTQKTGNVFSISQASGEVNLKQAGLGGAGVIVPDSLEGSTSDIASELTKTIGIQANYNANATLISTVKAMEDELNRRL